MDYVTFPFEKFVSCITTEYDVQADSILALYIEIGKYLRDNPIVSGLTVKEIIDRYLEENPPSVGVISVNGKTGVVTGLYSAENPPPYPVTSVNGKTGDVTIQEGGGASGVTSVNGQTGNVKLKVVNVLSGESIDENVAIFIDEDDDYPDQPANDSYKLNGLPASDYLLKKDDVGALHYSDHVRWYIDGVNGNDDNDGSIDRPFKTLDKFFSCANNITTDIRAYIVHSGIYGVTKPVINGCVVHITANVPDVTIYFSDNSEREAFYNCHLNLKGLDVNNKLIIDGAFGSWYTENSYNLFTFVKFNIDYINYGGGDTFEQCELKTLNLTAWKGYIHTTTYTNTDPDTDDVNCQDGCVVRMAGSTSFANRNGSGNGAHFRFAGCLVFLEHGANELTTPPNNGVVAYNTVMLITSSRQATFNDRSISGNIINQSQIINV